MLASSQAAQERHACNRQYGGSFKPVLYYFSEHARMVAQLGSKYSIFCGHSKRAP
jgi:hypothetical protein